MKKKTPPVSPAPDRGRMKGRDEMSTECLSAARAAQIRDAVKERYAAISSEPNPSQIPYPTGRASLARLGYKPEWLAGIPARIVDRFIGIGNPFGIRPVKSGERVLDLGCGSGLDAFVAASLVGSMGKVVGIDLTPEMLEWARKAREEVRAENLCFMEGDIEALPFEDASFDLALSNGVLNLVPDKDAAFREIARVLRDGGDFVAADIVVMETIPDDVLKSVDAWSA